MVKQHLLLESEKKLRFIDERAYRDRLVLEKCQKIIEGSDFKTIIDKDKQEKKVGREPLLKEQQIVLKEYFERMLSNKRLKAQSIYLYICHLYDLGNKLKKPYSSITQQDLISYFARLHELSRNSIILLQCIMRQFFAWLNKKDVISWIKFAKREKRELTPEALLTPEDIKKLVSVCQNARDKCVIMMTYEGALRIGEVAHIKIKDISESEHGITVRVDGKTGVRSMLLIDTVSYYKAWRNIHEYKDILDAPLFYSFAKNEYGRSLREQGVGAVIRHSAKIAELTKLVFPHLLRHSRLDYLGRQGFRERDLKIFAGWSDDSKMANTYLHYGQEEVDKKLLELKGISSKQEKKLDKTFEPVTCASCNKLNPPTTMYCDCGELLIEGKREKADAIMNKLFENDEFKALVKRLLQKEQG